MKKSGLVLLTATICLSLAGCVTSRPAGESGEDAAVANMNLGAGYLRQGKLDLAVDRLQRALDQDPRLALAHATIAVAYDQLGDLEQAEEHYRRAAQLEPNNAAVVNSYAVFLCRQQRWQDARPYFRRAADSRDYRTPEVALTNAGICARDAGAIDDAATYFREALTRSPTYPDALVNMMELSYDAGNYLQARAFVQRYLDARPATAGVLLICFNVEQQLGNAPGAQRCAEQLRAGFQGSAELAQLEAEQGRNGR
jgi:type IV pilus assembly protein PilF